MRDRGPTEKRRPRTIDTNDRGPPEKRRRVEPLHADRCHYEFGPRDADRAWNVIESGIDAIFRQNIAGFSYTKLLDNVYKVVTHQFGESLYNRLRDRMRSRVEEFAKSVEHAHGDEFLQKLTAGWVHFNDYLLMLLSRIFWPLNEHHAIPSKKDTVEEFCWLLWKNHVLCSPTIHGQLLHNLLDLIHRERTGEKIDRGLLRRAFVMLEDLDLYSDGFEKKYLEASANFYKIESQKFIECYDCGKYLKKAERLLNEETERTSQYLNDRTKAKIVSVVEKEMISNHMHRLIHMEKSGLLSMLVYDKHEDLGRMYALFQRIPDGLLTITGLMSCYLKETGKRFMMDPQSLKDPVEFVQRLLNGKDKHDNITSVAFGNEKIFHTDISKCYEDFINLNDRSPELIALYIDYTLGKATEDIDVALEKAMGLFRFLKDKDIFEKYYRLHLEKRLLSTRAVADEAERRMVVKLKQECGFHFTTKLEKMFGDIKISEDTMRGFYTRNHEELGGIRALNVRILTSDSWPMKPSSPCKLPADILTVSEKFKAYYLTIHNGRKFTWQTNMGTADLMATFGDGRKHELTVSTHQMCVLMLFNNAYRLTYSDIEQDTKIPASDLKRCLQSLCNVKGKDVLCKEPLSKDVMENDLFYVNDKFTSRHFKVKIVPLMSKNEPEPERENTRQQVEMSRQCQIECAIVRIMKSRKALEHNSLVAEVIQQTKSKFLPNVPAIKRCIGSLIEREFIERDAVDVKMYRYRA